MWCDNLPRLWGKLSQVTFSYKVVIINHSVTIEGNSILFNCSQGFTQNFGMSVFLNIECKKYKNLETKCVPTSPGLHYYTVDTSVRTKMHMFVMFIAVYES